MYNMLTKLIDLYAHETWTVLKENLEFGKTAYIVFSQGLHTMNIAYS